MEELKKQIEKKFKNLPENCKEEMYKRLSSKEGALYECEESTCNNKWKSHNLEKNCPKCNSHRITLNFEKKVKCGKYEVGGINFFDQDDWS